MHLAEFSLALPTEPRFLHALLVAMGFSAVGRAVRGVSFPGALAGALICFLLYAGAGPGAFALLVSVFILAWLTTRWGYQQKQKLGTAERRDGRAASQVFANLAVAAICAVLHVLRGDLLSVLALAAALAEAAADTVSSEVGQAAGAPARLITTWRPVPAGTDGAISLPGTLAGIGAAVIVSLVACATGLIPWKWLAISVLAATLGMLADSCLGALFERKGALNNNAVNFLGTLSAAVCSVLIAL